MVKEKDISSAKEDREKLAGATVKTDFELPFSLLQKHKNKTSKLVAKAGNENAIKGSKRWFSYEFREPLFLASMSVHASDYESYHDFEFQWETVEGKTLSRKISPSENSTYRIQVNELIRSVKFRPPSRIGLFSNPMLNRVELEGFKKSELAPLVSQLTKLESEKLHILSICDTAIQNADQANSKVVTLAQQETEINQKIETANSTMEELNTSISNLEKRQAELQSENTVANDNIKNAQSRLDDIEDNIVARKAERETISGEIVKKRSDLNKLQSNINMFPTELSAFADQGGRDISIYAKWGAAPMLLLILMTGLLVFNAADLTTVLDDEDGASIWSIFVTRLPYVLISTAVIGACYKLLEQLISEVMKINRQRLNLSKVSIVATDTSLVAEDGLSLSEEEKYQLRTRHKMNLLRDHLKNDLTKGFFGDDRPTKIDTEPDAVLNVDHSDLSGPGEDEGEHQ